ncbi:MalY/PatB family protein [Proteiniborus sp.]|uniref:MalY/PatB family protein n=1 Tax=Proteiniborus sp. TaxID=2079015 RepID=UPI0033236519
MKYDFDKVLNRWNTRSEKWDGMLEHFGTNDLIPMWEADMEFEVAPALSKAMIERAQQAIYGYTIATDSFYESVVNWQKRRNNWLIEKDWIRTSNGAMPSIVAAIYAFTKPGDKVIVQDPVFYKFEELAVFNGRHVVKDSLIYEDGKYSIDFDSLEKLIDPRVKMLVLCNPQNPIGRVFTKDELLKIGEICLKNDIIILADEIYSDVIFSESKHIPISSLSEELAMNTVTVFGPGKGFNITGLKATLTVISNPKLRAEYDLVAEALETKLKNIFAVIAIEEAYNNCEDWLNEAVKYIEQNRDFMMDYIENNIPGVKMVKPEGTYVGWLDFRSLGLTDKELEHLALEKMKIGFKYGYAFGKCGQGFQRLNFACPKSELLKALQRIENAVKSL